MLLKGFSGRKAICDVEVYPNYILVRFEDVDTRELSSFRIDTDHNIDDRKAAEAYYRSLDVAITYNGHGYDDHILDVTFKSFACKQIFQHGDDLINNGGRRYSPFLRYGERKDGFPLSIDLAQVILYQGRFPSLKALGNRFGYKHLQTLPIPPGTVLTDEQKQDIDDYNLHDLNITRLLLERLDAAIEMRRVLSEEYGVNLTSAWDAKLGSTIVETAYTQAANDRICRSWDASDGEPPIFKLTPPKKNEWLCGGSDLLSTKHRFTHPSLIALHQQVKGWTLKWRRYKDNDGELQVETPSNGTKVKLDDKNYAYLMGGLHTEDGPLIRK